MMDDTWAVLGTGPSLKFEDCELLRIAGVNTIAVNNAYLLAPWARMLYACDFGWWMLHHENVKRSFKGELWTQDKEASIKYGLRRVVSEDGLGLARVRGVVRKGSNSGHQAVNLAFHMGAKRIILLGFDMKGTHFFGEHPIEIWQANDYPLWIAKFKVMARDLRDAAVQVVNCSPDSALPWFEKRPLREALCAYS